MQPSLMLNVRPQRVMQPSSCHKQYQAWWGASSYHTVQIDLLFNKGASLFCLPPKPNLYTSKQDHWCLCTLSVRERPP